MNGSKSPHPYRYWGLAGGIVLAIVDTLATRALGIHFEINGHDATWFVGAFFGSSSAVLGYLVGSLFEGRRRDRAQAELIQAQTEMLVSTRTRLAQSEKLAALGQLAGAIAHEVRNPLAVMRSAAQGVLEDEREASAETKRGCNFIITEIDRLHSVVTSLLAFARPLPLKRQTVVVAELLERTVELAREELRTTPVTLGVSAARDLRPIHGDPDLLCQVLLGLIANAGEAMASGGDIVIEAAMVEDALEIAVADSGPGVPPELKGRVFEPFFTTRAKGTGLGLAVARQIVAAHAGTIGVQDRPGGGARFVVRLPDSAVAAEAA